MGTCDEVRNLFAFSARYTGPDSTRTAANDDMNEEQIHDAVLSKQYTLKEANTRKGHDTRLKRWYWYCKEGAFVDLHPYPATKLHNYLKVDLNRNVVQGNKGIDINVQDTLGSLRKLATIQGCPAFTDNEASLLGAVTAQARKATQGKALQTPNDHDRSAQNRQTLTRAGIDNMFAICAQSPRLVGARAQVLLQLGLQTGFRGCELIHTKWYDMQMQEADQLCHIGPDAFKAVGIGINQGKTNKTGAMRWTGFAQHAYAHCDLAASLGELLSCEIFDNDLRLMDMILDKDQSWDKVTVFFPQQVHKPLDQRVGQLTRLLDSITKRIPDWSKDKRMHLFRKSVTQQLRLLGAEHGTINAHLGWADDVQGRYYSLADLQAGEKPQAILAGFTKGCETWHQHHYLGRSTVSLPSTTWLDAVIPRLTEALQRQDAVPVRSREMLQCLHMYAQAYWQALPMKGLIYKEAYLDRQVPGVQQVMQTAQYRQFAEQVIMKEADSLQKLGLEAVHMDLWTSSTSQGSSAEPASTAETVSMSATETSANKDKCTLKRKRNEGAHDSDPEEQALLEAIDRQKRINALRLQLCQEQQRGTEIPAAQQTVARVLSNAEQHAHLPAGLTVQACLQQDDQSSIAAPNALPMQAALPSLAVPAQGISALSNPQRPRPTPTLRNPVFFAGSTVAERYEEWADDGQHNSVKSRLVLTKRGLALPKTGHEGRASDNLRRNRNLPEAIDRLILKGLTREAAIALVERVVSNFGGLKSIAQVSNAFHQMAHKSAAAAETTALGNTGKTVMAFKLAYEQELAKTLTI